MSSNTIVNGGSLNTNVTPCKSENVATNSISDNVASKIPDNATNNMDVVASDEDNQRWIKNKDYFRLDGKNSNDQRKKMIEKFNDESDRELVYCKCVIYDLNGSFMVVIKNKKVFFSIFIIYPYSFAC